MKLIRAPQVLLEGPTAIRPLAREDASALLAARARSRVHLAPWEPVRDATYFTLEWQRSLCELSERAWVEDTAYGFAVVEGTELVGGVNLSNVVRGAWHNCTVGYWLAADATGLGHATRALRLALGFAFVYAELHRVQAAIIPTNTASLAVVRRVGMRHEGTALRYLRIAGAWQDHEIFATTLEDWLDRS